MTQPVIEICVEGLDEALAAEAAGADRVELCASLLEGGLTPSMGVIQVALERLRIPAYVIVRPRGGDFLYSEAEFAAILADIRAIKAAGGQGVVIGFLTPDGRIDEDRTRAAVEAARPMSVTCHRAFDMTRDPAEAVEALVRCGVDRVLTSGQRATAEAGSDILKSAIRAAAGRITVMVCGDLHPDRLFEPGEAIRGVDYHFASVTMAPSGMQYRNPHVFMGGTDIEREYLTHSVDAEDLRTRITALRTALERSPGE